jgi:hypothetical protein
MSADHGVSLKSQLPRLQRLLIDAIVEPATARATALSASEWADLPAVAHRHGLSALLPGLLAGRPDAPAKVADAAAQLGLQRAAQALRGAAQLGQLTETLTAHGIASVALKGPAFSLWLYGDVGFRRFADLDLLVDPRQIAVASKVLREHGYRLPGGMSAAAATAIFDDLGAWPLSRAGSLPIDLHWRVAQRRFAARLATTEVIDRRVPLEALRSGVTIPCATHIAVLTLSHAAKHLWCTLEMLLAIATLMRRDDVDWASVVATARAGHGWRGAAAGMALASALFETPVPVAAGSDVTLPVTLRRAAFDALTLPAGVFPDRWAEREAHRAALDRPLDRLRYDASRLLSPTPLEWEWWPLPDSWTRLYPVIRLMRLGGAAAGAALGRRPTNVLSETTAAPVRPDDAATPSIRAGRG